MDRAHAFYAVWGLNVATYDERIDLAGTPVAGDVAFYVEQALRSKGPMLELGAGTGRVAWAVASAGVEVLGLDISEAMIRRAEERREQMPATHRELARFVLGDMSDYALEQRFALAVVPFRAFQSLITPESQRSCLSCTHRHLETGGRLIVDLFDPRLDYCLPEGHAAPMQRNSVRHPRTGNRVAIEVVDRSNDPLRQVLTERWRFTELDDKGNVRRQEEQTLTLRWTYRYEMAYLAELCGFEVEAEYSDFDYSPPAYGREQVWVLKKV